MIFNHFRLNIIEVNSFLIGCDETKEVMLIDAGEAHPSIFSFLDENDYTLTKIFITHDHYDHTDGLKHIAHHYHCKTYSCTEDPGGFNVDEVVKHGDVITVGTLTGRVVDTSGHTPVGVSLIFPGHVFSGDALFAGSVGGTSSDENYEQQINLIRKNLFTLPDDYEVHVGHGPSTTIGIEKAWNPFFV
jgi:glyoxylase-like metal-dependent hydrolase (beta-lactamase superfamily II)